MPKEELILETKVQGGKKTAEELKRIAEEAKRATDSAARGGERARKKFTLFQKITKKLGATLVSAFKSPITALIGFTAIFSSLVISFREGLRAAREIEKGFANINTLISGAGGLTHSTKKLIIEQSKLYGRTIQDNQKAYYDIISAGITDQEKALEVLNQANQAAVAGLTSVGGAAKALVAVMNSYGKENITVKEVSDTLFSTVKAGITTFGELSQYIGTIAPLASTAGVSFQELGAVLATVTANGVQTAEAATQLRGLMVSLTKQSPELKKKIQSLGVEWDLNAVKAKGLIKTLTDMYEATDGNVEVISKFIPNIRGLLGVLGAVKDGGVALNKTLANFKETADATADALQDVNETMDQEKQKAIADYTEKWAILSATMHGADIILTKTKSAFAHFFSTFSNVAMGHINGVIRSIKNLDFDLRGILFAIDSETKKRMRKVEERVTGKSGVDLKNIRAIGKDEQGFEGIGGKLNPLQTIAKNQFTSIDPGRTKGKASLLDPFKSVVQTTKTLVGEALNKFKKLEKLKLTTTTKLTQIWTAAEQKISAGINQIKEKTEQTIISIKSMLTGGALGSILGVGKGLQSASDRKEFKKHWRSLSPEQKTGQSAKDLQLLVPILNSFGEAQTKAFKAAMNTLFINKGSVTAQDKLGYAQSIQQSGAAGDSFTKSIQNDIINANKELQKEARSKSQEQIDKLYKTVTENAALLEHAIRENFAKQTKEFSDEVRNFKQGVDTLKTASEIMQAAAEKQDKERTIILEMKGDLTQFIQQSLQKSAQNRTQDRITQ